MLLKFFGRTVGSQRFQQQRQSFLRCFLASRDPVVLENRVHLLKLIVIQAGSDFSAELLVRHAFEQKLKPFSGFVNEMLDCSLSADLFLQFLLPDQILSLNLPHDCGQVPKEERVESDRKIECAITIAAYAAKNCPQSNGQRSEQKRNAGERNRKCAIDRIVTFCNRGAQVLKSEIHAHGICWPVRRKLQSMRVELPGVRKRKDDLLSPMQE